MNVGEIKEIINNITEELISFESIIYNKENTIKNKKVLKSKLKPLINKLNAEIK